MGVPCVVRDARGAEDAWCSEPSAILGRHTGFPTMIRRAVVRCAWDPEAHVWFVRETDVPSLVTEATTLDALRAKLPDRLRDLLDADEALDVELSVET